MFHYSELTTDYLDSLDFELIKTSKKIQYINLECGFDIETTSEKQTHEKCSYMYIWQLGLGLGNKIFYGRTWQEFIDTMELLSGYLGLNSDKVMIIYVHNLSYEFQFMRKYFNWLNVFAVSERKPIKALTDLGIEFRDSYILSGFSLANTAKNLTKYKMNKMVGDLDYSKTRNYLTPLTEKELMYCELDIKIILAYIKEQIEYSGNITKIPLTNTGRVRKFVKDNCYYTNTNHKKTNKGKYYRYSKIMMDLTLDLTTYKQLKRAFMGGFTHSNPLKTDVILTNVDSIDLTSSYPTVMLSDKFPMSRPRKLLLTTVEELKVSFNKYCVLFDVKFTGLKNKLGYESYLSDSKCRKQIKPVVNNGRIFEAESLVTTITDVDFNIIEQVYTWDEIRIQNVTGFVKNYLPKSIIESILELYQKKTTLKDVEGSEVEYLLSKGMLNSVYGMSVTDFIKDDNVYINDSWDVEPINPEEKIEEYNTSKNRFLYYPWGIWVTAYARRNLWSAILNVGDDYIYSDTDSVKMLNFDEHKKYVERYNKHVLNKLTIMMNHYKLDVDLLTPKTIEGIDKPLGVWDYEGHYTMFKTLGAKRYLIEEKGKVKLTVAGLSKKNGIEYLTKTSKDNLEVFNKFTNELYIPESGTGKMTHTYLDEPITVNSTDYLGNSAYVETLSGIHLEGCEFTLSVSKQYQKFLHNLSTGYTYTGVKHI